MNTRKLTHPVFTGIIAVAFCLLGQPAMADSGNQVPRPVKVLEGHLTITVDMQTGEYEFTDWAWASHTGLNSNSGAGVLDLTTGVFLSGTGLIVAANGDTISWTVGGNLPNTVLYTGGTGRFEGVTGSISVFVASQTLLSDNGDGTMTFLMTYTGAGTIIY
ncbi:MAG TPA: hypothetical protein VFZ59_22845 [Verrucomicrobiae bacterium]|nr:hypothetical protein [Verrucomicrobiae bacterium]